MPMTLPCVSKRSTLTLHSDCYDKRGRKIYLEPPAPAMPLEPDIVSCGNRGGGGKLRSGSKQQQQQQQRRTLPPGTRAPGAVATGGAAAAAAAGGGAPRGSLAGSRRKFGNKPPPSQKRIEGAKATFFHVQGQSWESKGFAQLDAVEVERMRATRPRTAEEKLYDQERRLDEQRRYNEEAERIRNYFHDIDEVRREKEREKEREQDALAEDNIDEGTRTEAKRVQVLHKALNSRYESDVRVKEATRAINEAKCSAMWTAQIQERRLLDRIKANFDEEQNSKNNEYNQSKWGTLEQRDLNETEKRMKFGNAVRQQISDREKLRFMAQDRSRDEAKQVQAAIDEFKRFEAEQSLLNNTRKSAYRDELHKYIKLHKDFRRLMCEQEQRDERRAYDYVLEKEKKRKADRAEREAIEADQKRKRDILFAVQQKIIDAKDNRDEMRFLAERERLERRYRDEERQAAEKERRLVTELKQANLDQMEQISKLKACYYVQREKELKQILKDRNKFEEEKKKEAEQLLAKKDDLRTAVAMQMEEREKIRRRDQEEERLNYEKSRAAEALRQKEIDMVIAVKLDDLAKKNCLPNVTLRSLTGRLTYAGQKKLGANLS
ncbi:trichohyalin [Drosophila willistoni]|nr:trichohyalin [Drosophila willistoni]